MEITESQISFLEDPETYPYSNTSDHPATNAVALKEGLGFIPNQSVMLIFWFSFERMLYASKNMTIFRK